MRYVESITEDDMIALFLKTEIGSERFGKDILVLLERDGVERTVINDPDTSDEQENEYRRQLLGDFRGYGQDRDLFKSFPDDVCWHRVALSKEELARVKYVDYSYWNELTGGSRLPVDAAQNIRAGIEVFGESTEGFFEIAHAFKNGAVFPELILVSSGSESEFIVLEGHVRLTAYFLVPEHIPEELKVIVGFSPGIDDWV